MAKTFKEILNNDRTTTRTLLHEAIPITGSILSGTYAEPGSAGSNIKEYAHGMFHSVYDYPYLSSSANHIFDLTTGFHTDSSIYALALASTNSDYKKKKNLYNQMAQVLMGHDITGSIQKFDQDGDIAAGGTKYTDVFFMNFARLLGKDELKKGTFELQLGISGSISTPFGKVLTIQDAGAATSYHVNSPAGEYGILKVTADDATTGTTETHAEYTASCGLIFYQAGVAVLTKDVFTVFGSGSAPDSNQNGKIGSGSAEPDLYMDTDNTLIDALMQTGTINALNTAFRSRVKKVSFNNTTELNSTIYFCRINSSEFNYSANPTYLSSSQIRVKRTSTDAPVSYFTTVGLYSAAHELLAVAKLSEPLRKDPTNDMTIRVRLDY
tara:strand:+ start:4277 stop:5422 length:1146 start_codon:yes stop_codon:yes gene_type:complete